MRPADHGLPGRQLSRDQTTTALENASGLDVQEGIPLAPFTSFNIGGPAAYFVEINDRESLAKTLIFANSLRLKTLVLGGGTNLLASDEGFDGLAIRLTMDAIEIDRSQARVRVGASIPTNRLVEATLEAGLTGLEFAAGLPGTAGGAVAGNAGCFGHTLSEFLVGAMIVEQNGALDEIANLDRFGFQYRCCRLVQSGAVLTDVVFGLETGDPVSSKKEAEKCLSVRAEKHPTRETRTAGSYFKNLPPDEPGGLRRAAGALLDQAGVHGLSVGDAAVFERHANIIINRGNATARDVLTLAAQMKRRVLEQFGVELEEEVRFVGKRPDGM